MTTALVALAGAVGAVTRYRIGVAVGVRTFPWATLGINISGSFLLAVVLAGPAVSRWSNSTSIAIAVGLLGAYTTFSTFGYETVQLIRADRVSEAMLYVFLSLGGGLVATAIGLTIGRGLA